MKNVLSIILIFFFQSTLFANDSIWNNLISKTWFSSNNWAGEQIVFYKTKNELPKAIRQIHGSGVYITLSMIYDIEIKGDSVILTHALDLAGDINQDEKKEEKFVLIYNSQERQISDDTLNYRVIHNISNIYNWTKSPASGELINMNLLENIPLNKKVFMIKN